MKFVFMSIFLQRKTPWLLSNEPLTHIVGPFYIKWSLRNPWTWEFIWILVFLSSRFLSYVWCFYQLQLVTKALFFSLPICTISRLDGLIRVVGQRLQKSNGKVMVEGQPFCLSFPLDFWSKWLGLICWAPQSQVCDPGLHYNGTIINGFLPCRGFITWFPPTSGLSLFCPIITCSIESLPSSSVLIRIFWQTCLSLLIW